MTKAATYDFVVIGAGSAGCAVAAGLCQAGTSVAVVEAGPSDRHPFVKIPFALIWLMGSRHDWRFQSAPQAALNGRSLAVPRGRMLGGSGSINSMVWFRGRADDYDGWGIDGWRWSDVEPAFEEVEARFPLGPLASPHPITRKLGTLFGANIDAAPTPERESAGLFRYNMKKGRRWSAADAFLRPAQARGLTVVTGQEVTKIDFDGTRARTVRFKSGKTLWAERGIVLSAGAIGSPAILMASGIGPANDLRAAGIKVRLDAPGVGANLHDHPSVGLHFTGPGSGYGLSRAQALQWLAAPFTYAFCRRGPMASPTVEGGIFFASDGQGTPDIQTHLIPFFSNWQGSRWVPGEGYFADVCLCRPKSRGALRITPQGLSINFNLLDDREDLATLITALRRLRSLIAEAGLPGTEAFPGPDTQTDDDLTAYIRARCGTAYHPVGTLAMGGPVTDRLAVKGMQGLWVADASVMPNITSANTNAPSIMIGHRAAQIISQDAA